MPERTNMRLLLKQFVDQALRRLEVLLDISSASEYRGSNYLGKRWAQGNLVSILGLFPVGRESLPTGPGV